jgi:molybdopterin-guanine dinucleotide biosynthesis protein A
MKMTFEYSGATVRQAFLLAGRAERLPGKFLLPVEGVPIIEREIRTLRSLGLEVAVVSVRDLKTAGTRVIPDRRDAGPLGGLAAVCELTSEPFFLFGGDMPFLDGPSIERMRSAFDGRTTVARERSGELSVLHAIYLPVERKRLERLLACEGGLRDLVDELAKEGRLRILPEGTVRDESFVDVDTPEAYATLRGGESHRHRRRAAGGRARLKAS